MWSVIKAPLKNMYTWKRHSIALYMQLLLQWLEVARIYIKKNVIQVWKVSRGTLVSEVITKPWLYEKLEPPLLKAIIMPRPPLEQISALQHSSKNISRSLYEWKDQQLLDEVLYCHPSHCFSEKREVVHISFSSMNLKYC